MKNIWLHLKRSKVCQDVYDMVKIEKDHDNTLKEKQKAKVKKWRQSLDSERKEIYNMKEKERKKQNGEMKSNKAKELSNK